MVNQGGNATRYVHDGDALIAEYRNSDNALLRRYVHGTNAEADDPLVWYEGAGTARSDRRYLYADPRGSIVLTADADGNTIAINAYDEYGIPTTSNNGFDITTRGRFRYTGQVWLPELGMYYYKARIYSPTLGRFMQTDPIGYEDQFNLYAYVANDPINGVDPTGKRTRRRMSRAAAKEKENETDKGDAKLAAELVDAGASAVESSDGSPATVKAVAKAASKGATAAAVVIEADTKMDKGHSAPAAIAGAIAEGATSTVLTGSATAAGGPTAGVAVFVLDQGTGASVAVGEATAVAVDSGLTKIEEGARGVAQGFVDNIRGQPTADEFRE